MAQNPETLELGSVKVDMPDGVVQSMSHIENYLRKLFLWGRILLVCIITLSLFGIFIYNFFSPEEKDISQNTINKLLKIVNAESLAIDQPPRVTNSSEWTATPKMF